MEMKGQKIIRGLSSLTLLILLLWIVYKTPTDFFKGFPEQAEMATLDDSIIKTASFIWKERLLDVISQALLVFSAIICAMLLIGGRRSG